MAVILPPSTRVAYRLLRLPRRDSDGLVEMPAWVLPIGTKALVSSPTEVS